VGDRAVGAGGRGPDAAGGRRQTVEGCALPAAAALRAGLGRPVVILPTAAPPPRRSESGGGWAEGRRTADYMDSIRLFACLLHALPAADADAADAGPCGDGGV
jgi:hypothetical protein